MQRFDARYIAITGLLLFAASSFMNIWMSVDYSGDQFWVPNIVRAVGQALTLAPLSAVTLGSREAPGIRDGVQRHLRGDRRRAGARGNRDDDAAQDQCCLRWRRALRR
jgi:hypothetical protein